MTDVLEPYRREIREALHDRFADGGMQAQTRGLKHPDDLSTMSDGELASFGRDLAIDVHGREAIRRSEDTSFAHETFDIHHKDALVNSMGVHLTMIRGEGLASYRAFWHADAAGNRAFAEQMKERAAGLLWAIGSTQDIIQRAGQTPQGESMQFSVIDTVNLFVGVNTYERVADDHHRGFKEMRDTIVAKSETLQEWDKNFMLFTHKQWSLKGLLAAMDPKGDESEY